MKSLFIKSHQLIQKDLFTAMIAIALSCFVFASPVSYADKTAKSKPAAVQQKAVKVNINHASIKDLTALEGVGEKKAIAIVQHRNKHGKFKSVEQLAQVKGIGMAIVEKNKKNIRL